MSVKKQIPSLCKLYSFHEEIPEEFLDETDVDSYFYRNNFDISQSQNRIVRVSRGSNKKSFEIKFFQFCDLKTQQRYILQEAVKPPKERSFVWSTVCAKFSKLLITLASAYRFPYRSSKLRLHLQSQKTIFFIFTIPISLNTQLDKFVYRSDLETTDLAYFRSKNLNYTAIKFFLQKLSTLTIAKFTISTRTDFTLQTNVK